MYDIYTEMTTKEEQTEQRVKTERFLQATKDMTSAEVAVIVGKNVKTIERWQKRFAGTDADLKRIAEEKGLRPEWLLKGEGEMKSAPPTVAEEAPAYNNNESSPLRRVPTADADAGDRDPLSGTITFTVNGQPALDVDVSLRQFHDFKVEIGKRLAEIFGFDVGPHAADRDTRRADTQEERKAT